ncbi:hypothetical protein [Companilactobacillus zhongbaensis]|uniref:hypothetical protein n=1 Tax=Companilactobacillus zhongbaensis TaxID=2486009 RepID=UPI000F7B2285|nr:hypothetical protein [Companilactobacillus zhongbaensis]
MEIIMSLLLVFFILGIFAIIATLFLDVVFYGFVFALIILGIYLLVKGVGLLISLGSKIIFGILFLLKWLLIIIAVITVIIAAVYIFKHLQRKISRKMNETDENL